MKGPEKLVGERIVLRKAQMSDLDPVYENIYCDEELLSTTFITITKDKTEAEARLKRTVEWQKERMLYFVTLKETDEVIGLGGMMEESEGVWSEGGLVIARKYQGRGYGKELLSILLEYAFGAAGVKTFAYYCMDFNVRSAGLAKSFGFEYDSTSEEIREYDQKKFNVQRYLLTREKYEEMRKKK